MDEKQVGGSNEVAIREISLSIDDINGKMTQGFSIEIVELLVGTRKKLASTQMIDETNPLISKEYPQLETIRKEIKKCCKDLFTILSAEIDKGKRVQNDQQVGAYGSIMKDIEPLVGKYKEDLENNKKVSLETTQNIVLLKDILEIIKLSVGIEKSNELSGIIQEINKYFYKIFNGALKLFHRFNQYKNG